MPTSCSRRSARRSSRRLGAGRRAPSGTFLAAVSSTALCLKAFCVARADPSSLLALRAAFPTKDGAERIVTPYASTGNTDTSLSKLFSLHLKRAADPASSSAEAMHALSRSIFRFKGEPGHGGGNAHTVDERASIDGHLGIISWIATIVQNADAFTGEE
jgi:hypothetical protein